MKGRVSKQVNRSVRAGCFPEGGSTSPPDTAPVSVGRLGTACSSHPTPPSSPGSGSCIESGEERKRKRSKMFKANY